MSASYSKAAAPRNTAATKVVAENWRSDEAALKVEVGDAAAPDSEAVPVLTPEVPAAALVPVPVATTEEPVWVAEDTAVTKPVAVELSEVPVEVAVVSVTTLWPSWAQLLAKNFREVSLSAQFLEMADWILLAPEPQIVFESAGLGWLPMILRTQAGVCCTVVAVTTLAKATMATAKMDLLKSMMKDWRLEIGKLEIERLDSGSHSESGVKECES